jgi:hypothetical protein
MILGALYADGDSVSAERLVAVRPRRFANPTTLNIDAIREQYAFAQHDLAFDRLASVHGVVSAWRSSTTNTDTVFSSYAAAHFAVLLDAQLAVRESRPDALARLTELDSLLLTAPRIVWFQEVGNLVAAELWHQRGDEAKALACARRRFMGLLPRPTYVASLREEGRYAALAGERDEAIRAYRQYLALRSDPEPAVRPKIDEVRAELAALERESADQ